MLPPNLLTVSIIILLAATVSTAPVEEKEQEEVETEVTETVEGEVSEEEEDDDDDSKSQDMIKGAPGAQQTTVSAAPAGGSGVSPNIQDLSASSGQSVGRGPHDAAAGSSAGHGGDVSSLDSAAAGHPSGSSGSSVFAGSADSAGSAVSSGSADSAGSAVSSGSADSAGSVSSAGSIAVDLSGVSAGQTHPAGAKDPSHTGMNGPVGVDLGSNGNGQKLLNGGGGGAGVEGQTGDLGSLGGGASHLDYTGIIDPSSHDYLLGLIGAGLVDPFGTDAHVNIPGHMTPPTHLDASGVGSGVTAAPSAEQNILDSPGGPALTSADHHSAGSSDQSGAGGASLSSGSDQSSSGSLSGSSAAASSSSSSSDSAAHREHTGGADSPDTAGNGRQTHLTDTNRAVTERLVSFSDLQTLQTDLTGGSDSATGLHIDLTASGLQLGRDVTEMSPVASNTDSTDGVTNTLSPVSGVYSHTDQVTVIPDSTGTDTVPAGPTGTPLDSSHPAVTDHVQMAGSITEQYNPSGQGPEGAENVELEDTC